MKVLGIIINGILTSMYIFHFEFVGMEGFNTKRMLAFAGSIVFIMELAKKRNAYIDNKLLILTLFALAVSLISFVSTTYNNNFDTTYSYYFLSMWVWLTAAYFVISMMRVVHGEVTVPIICNYLICVAVFQCIIAIMIDRISAVKNFVNTYFELDQKFLENTTGMKRKYGIGASVDVGGSRFSAILVTLAVMINYASKSSYRSWIPFYIFAFFIITIVGNVISRTTTVGAAFALGYAIVQIGVFRNYDKKTLSWSVVFLATIVTLVTFLYNVDETVNKDLRFGFEGFFSLVQKGDWEVASNDKLKDMYVWPDNEKTWIIGDGYFENPRHTDPYFVGELTGGYYKGTDVGYLRFIFYFGMVGLLAFMAYFWKSASICASNFRQYRVMFYMLLLLNYVIWFKVATDLFLVFALFLALSAINKADIFEKEVFTTKVKNRERKSCI